MYSVSDFGRMAADTVRMDAYCRAIQATVKPGSIVLDLGAGTGVVSLLAIRAGAARVHAVDPNPAVWLIPELASESSIADRITIHHASSSDIEVPERVDVVISDLRGPTPLLNDHLAAIRDVRRRWLAPGGTLVPAVDHLQVAVAEAQAFASRLTASESSFERLGFSATAARRSIRNEVHNDGAATLLASDVLSTTGTWGTIDYASFDAQTIEGTVELEITRGGTANGLSIFFTTELCKGVSFTTAPGNSLVYGRTYLPLEHPTLLVAGDRARVTVRADVRGERWAWDTELLDSKGVSKRAQRQSTFLGAPMSLATLQRGSESFTPKLTRRGERLRELLMAMDGTRSVRDVADLITGRYEELDRGSDIVDEVRALAMRYGG